MLLQTKETGNLIEIMDLEALISPNQKTVTAKDQRGQEEQEAEEFEKTTLAFPSGEDLPRCWLDPDYRK